MPPTSLWSPSIMAPLSLPMLSPPAKYNFTMGKVISVFYCVVTPLVNPLVLHPKKQKDVKKAFRKVLAQKSLLSARHIQEYLRDRLKQAI